MIVVYVMEDPRTGAPSQAIAIPQPGVWHGVSLRSPYLVSAGQSLEIGLSAQVVVEKPDPKLNELIYAPWIIGKHPGLDDDDNRPWWQLPQCLMPSERPLYAILGDAIQHGVDNPKHGTDCVCMDAVVWELRRHIDRVLPEVERHTIEIPDCPEPTIHLNPQQWEANMKARQRIHGLLHALMRSL